MKPLQQIKDGYALELGYKNWVDYCENVENMSTLPDINEHVTEIAKRYAEECCKATLEKAVEKLWRNNFALSTYLVLDTSNIVLL